MSTLLLRKFSSWVMLSGTGTSPLLSFERFFSELFLKKAKNSNSKYIETRKEHDFKAEQLKRVFLLTSSGA